MKHHPCSAQPALNPLSASHQRLHCGLGHGPWSRVAAHPSSLPIKIKTPVAAASFWAYITVHLTTKTSFVATTREIQLDVQKQLRHFKATDKMHNLLLQSCEKKIIIGTRTIMLLHFR